MTEATEARILALKVLLAVEKEKAYAGLALQKAELPQRELRFATELVYGTLRERSMLDWWLERGTGKAVDKFTPEVLCNLRLALYQCAFLDSVPCRAAVDQAVELAKKFSPRAVRFVNWALRAILRKKEPFPQPPKEDRYLATHFSHPQWLVKLWLDQLGQEATEKLLAANQIEAPLALRANTLRTEPQELSLLLEGEGIQTEQGALPESLVVSSGRPIATEAFDKGLFLVQSEASQLVSHLLAPKPGQRVLDLCSAPGSKTTHLAQLMENKGQIVACDLYQHRLKLVEENCQRLGITIVETLSADGRQIKDKVGESFHKVLVDAPCSGLGVMRGKPDLRWHKTPEEIAQLPLLQRELLWAAASITAPGGELCYSTCTINRAENQDLVAQFLAAHPNFQPLPFARRLPKEAKLPDAGGMLQLLPSEHGLDGFFFALFKRIS
jgi:16S rRNA (cytosine967-C5)-methyltransferase